MSKVLTKQEKQITSEKNNSLTKDIVFSKNTTIAKQLRSNQASFNLAYIRKATKEYAKTLNPIIIFSVIPGLFFLPASCQIIYFVVVLFYLIILSIPLAPVYPRLELDRLFIFFAQLSCLPSALFFSKFLNSNKLNNSLTARGILQKTLRFLKEKRAIAEKLASIANNFRTIYLYLIKFAWLGALLLPLLYLWNIYSGKHLPLQFMDETPKRLAAVIRNNSNNGRTLFTGCVVHDLSFGHIAPLAHFAKRPLIASSYQHDIWTYTDAIPESFRKKGVSGIEEYFELFNVTLVVAHESNWQKWLARRKKLYAFIEKVGNFEIYKRLNAKPSLFMQGQAEIIEEKDNLLKIKVHSSELLIKMNYLPFLYSSSCKLDKETVQTDINFVRLSECNPGTTVTISSVSPFCRFFDCKDL